MNKGITDLCSIIISKVIYTIHLGNSVLDSGNLEFCIFRPLSPIFGNSNIFHLKEHKKSTKKLVSEDHGGGGAGGPVTCWTICFWNSYLRVAFASYQIGTKYNRRAVLHGPFLLKPKNTSRRPSAGSMLGQCRRQWTSVKPALYRRLLCAGNWLPVH